jgi:hypothetical protein
MGVLSWREAAARLFQGAEDGHERWRQRLVTPAYEADLAQQRDRAVRPRAGRRHVAFTENSDVIDKPIPASTNRFMASVLPPATTPCSSCTWASVPGDDLEGAEMRELDN